MPKKTVAVVLAAAALVSAKPAVAEPQLARYIAAKNPEKASIVLPLGTVVRLPSEPEEPGEGTPAPRADARATTAATDGGSGNRGVEPRRPPQGQSTRATTDTSDGGSGVPEPWRSLADCESGNWVDGGGHEPGSARWDWAAPGTEVPPWGTTIHHGGLQFQPSTWEWVAGDLGLLEQYPHAYDAPPRVQVEVATEVQVRQGWEAAWPVCSQRVGLR